MEILYITQSASISTSHSGLISSFTSTMVAAERISIYVNMFNSKI
jgi:hypothetical protein